MQTIAVLMTVHNRKDSTLECLRRLSAQQQADGCRTDIYMTDDGCTDGTPEAVAAEFPQVNIIRGDGNLFWNRGMYTAWDAAAKAKDYDYYLWLNDDTFVYPDMLATLLKVSDEKSNSAIVIGATQSRNHRQATYGGRLADSTIPTPCGQPVKVEYFNGNIVLIPRAVYRKLGNLDPYFTHSKGDFDYGLRAAKAGIAMFQVGSFLGECEPHGSIDKWCDPDVPLSQRWKALHRPNGMPPKEIFHFDKKHSSLFIAVFHYFTVYFRCLMPFIWTKRQHNR